MSAPTPDELKVLLDQQFLTLKQSVSDKIIAYMAEIERALHVEISKLSFDFPEGTFLKAGKLSKGEQYRGLPYFMLDYPRLFTHSETFAYRTMLWWANHLSCTLHLAGPVLTQNQGQFLQNLKTDGDAYFCVNNSPWEFHFETDNYQKVSELTLLQMQEHITKNGFLKVSSRLGLEDWEHYKFFALETFARFLRYF